MEAVELICIQCDSVFEFSISDAERYERLGYDPPRRCPACRRHKQKMADRGEDRRQSKKRDYNRKYA